MATYATYPNIFGGTLDKDQIVWPVVDDGQIIGQITFVSAWAVPRGVHKSLGMPDHVDLFVGSTGKWAATIAAAQNLLKKDLAAVVNK